MARTKEQQAAFNRALDEAFWNIVRGKLEDVKRSLDRFRQRIKARKALKGN
jgi:uncharacterized protein YpuA (DUF1002 family)